MTRNLPDAHESMKPSMEALDDEPDLSGDGGFHEEGDGGFCDEAEDEWCQDVYVS